MASNYQSLLDKLVDGHRVETLRNWINAFFIRKDGNKGLSANDYTDEDKAKVQQAVTKEELEALEKKLGHGVIPKGSLDTMADLDAIEEPEYGWMYNIRENGRNYVWCEGGEGEEDFWDDMGGDLSEYLKKDDLQVLTEEEIELLLGICSSPDGLITLLGEGGEISLNADVVLPSQQIIKKDTVLDLQGHEITSETTSALFVANGVKLTLKNGSVKTAGKLAIAQNGAEIVLESGSYDSGDVALQATGTGSKVTMNGGRVNAVEGGLMAFQGAEIELNSGTVEVSDNFPIGTNGSSGKGGNLITMNGGTLIGRIKSNGYEAIGVYIANNDTFVMNGGRIQAEGGAGILMRGGYVTINDGEITATAGPNSPGYIGDKKKKMSASGIIYDEASNYPGKAGMSLTVNGGSITGADHAIEVLSGEETPNVTVTGGSFSPAYPEE